MIPSSQAPETLEKLEDGTCRRLGGGEGGLAIQWMQSFSLAGWKRAGDPWYSTALIVNSTASCMSTLVQRVHLMFASLPQ